MLYRDEHGYLRAGMDFTILNIFEIKYSQLIQYEILEKLVTCICDGTNRQMCEPN